MSGMSVCLKKAVGRDDRGGSASCKTWLQTSERLVVFLES